MANIDVVARLQLNGSQFSSETGARFAEMKSRARSAAQDIRDSFGASFAEVNRLAQSALVLPRTTGGSLDLSSEIAQLHASALAADQRAIALRELAQAQIAAADAAGVDAQAMRLEADASAVASLNEERHAEEIRGRIAALNAVQAELGRATSATVINGDAAKNAAAGGSAMRYALQGLSYQAQDTFTQLSMGANVFQVIAIQGGQAAGMFANVEGSAGKFARFMIGPWGLAITAGLLVLGPLVSKLVDFGETAEETEKKLQAAAAAADSFGSAETLLGKVIDLTTGKLKTHNQVLIETIRLQAQASLQEANKKISDAGAQWGIGGLVLKDPGFGAAGVGGLGSGNIDAAIQGSKARAAQQRQIDIATRAIYNLTANDKLAQADPQTYAKNIGDALKIASERLDRIAVDGKVAGQSLTDVKLKLIALANTGTDKAAALEAIGVLNGGPVPDNLKPYARDKKTRTKKTPDLTRESESAAETIARINAEWDDQPRLIDKAATETLKLDNLIADLERRKPPGFEKLIDDARKAKVGIQEGLDRPYRDFVKSQEQGLAVQRLLLEGRDTEAAALQAALRISEQQGNLDDAHLAKLLQIAQQQERISISLEDQRRVVGMYVGAVGDLQQSFNAFLDDLHRKPGAALGNLVTNLVDDFNHLQGSILSEQIFGGLDRDIEKYIRKMTGEKTPAEILTDQAKASGDALDKGAKQNVSALEYLTQAYRDAAGAFKGGSGGGLLAANDNVSLQPSPELVAMLSKGNGVTGPGPYGNGSDIPDIEVVGHELSKAGDKIVSASQLFDFAGGRLVSRFEDIFGKLPPKLEKAIGSNLGKVLEGISYGQLGGSIFSSITGNKENKLASSVGGVLGNVAGKALGKVAGDAIGGGFGKLLGSAGGPIGSIVGGVLGPLVAGLFSKPKWSNATVTLNQYGDAVGGKGSGRGGDAIAAATGTASSVASGINAIADQLNATIKSLPAITLGTWNEKYRVALTATNLPLHSNNFGPDILKDFGSDQQAAIEYAVRYSISHAVIDGISKASQTILASGQDLQSAITKALLIEAVPRDLKAALDPVGAAIDALNLKWKHTVDAMNEGGATAEQLAQAQQLYNIQLANVKNSTASASQTLKDFMVSLKMGPNSSYSLRDQEATALAQLKPFLDQINAGQAIDQSKYQTAAQAYLDIERELYGSTGAYFDALDAVQAATSKAIASIDNVSPISPAVANPFAQQTATSAAQTATNTQATAEIGAQSNDLLARMNDNLEQLLQYYQISPDQGFIGLDRGFVSKTG